LGAKEFFTEKEAAEYFKTEIKATEDDDKVVHYVYKDFGLSPWQDGGKPNLRTSLIVDPPDGRIPSLTPEAQKRAATRRAAVKPLPESAADMPAGMMSCLVNSNVGP